MQREFVYTINFLNAWNSLGLGDDELNELENMLLLNSQIGDVIPNLNGARKVRIALKGKGKRGGGRVIYIDVMKSEKIYMLLLMTNTKKLIWIMMKKETLEQK